MDPNILARECVYMILEDIFLLSGVMTIIPVLRRRDSRTNLKNLTSEYHPKQKKENKKGGYDEHHQHDEKGQGNNCENYKSHETKTISGIKFICATCRFSTSTY